MYLSGQIPAFLKSLLDVFFLGHERVAQLVFSRLLHWATSNRKTGLSTEDIVFQDIWRHELFGLCLTKVAELG
jgi:hypothetical protein